MQKKKNIDLSQLNKELSNYLYAGFDLHFIHGWFCAYLSAPSESEEDLLIPTYLILDEESIKDEQKFAKLVDSLIVLYSDLSDNIYEKNKIIRPLIDFAKPNSFDPLLLTAETKKNLLVWLYGYLTCYLVTSGEITEYAPNQDILDDKFYPALFTLCVALIYLVRELNLDFMSSQMKDDFDEFIIDVKSMWESDEGESLSVGELFDSEIQKLDLADIIGALNDVFYVIRISDENKYAKTQNNTVLEKLMTRH